MPLIIPREIAIGFEGGPVFATSVISMSGGRTTRNKTRDVPVHEYSFTYINKDIDYLLDLKDLFIDARGQFELCLLWDHIDHDLVDEPQTTYMAESPEDLTFNLIKTYGTTNPWTRYIKYIVDGTLVVKANGSPVSVSFSSGIVTFDSAPPMGATITATCEFYVPGHLIVDRLSISAQYPNSAFGSVGSFGFTEDIDA